MRSGEGIPTWGICKRIRERLSVKSLRTEKQKEGLSIRLLGTEKQRGRLCVGSLGTDGNWGLPFPTQTGQRSGELTANSD